MLKNGLRQTKDIGKNQPFMDTCKFAKPTEFGVIEDTGVTSPFSVNQFDAFPVPQLIRGKGVTLLASDIHIKEIDESDWSVGTAVPTFDIYDELQSKEITAGDVWQIADFYNVFFLFNGSCMVVKTNIKGMFGGADRYLVQDEVTVQTGCDFKGRLIMAGFNPDDYWSSAWRSVWEQWQGKFPYGMSANMDIGENFIMWSSIGGGDTLNLFLPEHAIKGVLAEDETTEHMFLDMWERGELGFMPLPWQGTVRVVKPLGNGVVAYGENGVAALPAVTAPISTFGMMQIARFGIPHRGAVGGDENRHIFIDEAGTLWSLDADYKLENLGYDEYLIDLVGQDIIITMGEQEGDFYISGEDFDGNMLNFIYTATGLARSPHQVTSGYFTGGDFIGVSDTDEDTEVMLVTGELDFKYRDLKTITTIELGLDIDSSVEVHVATYYKYDTDLEYSLSEWILVNNEGFARIQMTAHDFKICIKLSNYINFKLSYANVKWQTSGRRTVRGLSDTQINT